MYTEKRRKMAKDMTSGNPMKLISRFTLPLLIGNVFQQFYNMADTYFVGRYIGVQALAAVGSTGSIVFFIISMDTEAFLRGCIKRMSSVFSKKK